MYHSVHLKSCKFRNTMFNQCVTHLKSCCLKSPNSPCISPSIQIKYNKPTEIFVLKHCNSYHDENNDHLYQCYSSQNPYFMSEQ